MYYLPDAPRLAKVKKSIAVDDQLAKEIDAYHRQLVKKAADSGARIPNQSNVYEDLVRRGWEGVKRQVKK